MKRRFVFLVGAFEPRTRISVYEQNETLATQKAWSFLDTISYIMGNEPPVGWTLELLQGEE